MAFVASLLGLAFCLVLAYSGFALWQDSREGNWTTSTIWALPLWIAYAPLPIGIGLLCLQYVVDLLRSEEHTSELQSLMRISYALSCSTQKNHINRRHTN